MADQGYDGAYAEFYHDHTERGVDDVEAYRQLAVEADGPVLELACGTGRTYLPALDAGVDIDGIDLSAGALDVLRTQADEQDLDPSVWQADMADFTVDRAYDLVYCPFNALQHVRSHDEQLAVFESVYEALADGGRFVFDVFVPSFELICETYGEWETEQVEFRGEACEVHTRTTLTSEVEQEFSVENRLVAPDGSTVFDVEQQLTMLPVCELRLLARCSPFGSWTVTGDFTGEPLTDDHNIQVWTLSAD